MDVPPDLNRTLTRMFVRMKAQTRDTAEAEAFRALKPLVQNGGTSIHMSAGGDKTLVFTQGAAATTWTIVHSLGKFPAVIIVDNSNVQMDGLITYVDVNELTIDFNTAVDGKAYLN